MSYGGLCEDQAGFPGPLDSIVERGSSSAQAAGVALTADESVNLATVTLLPPIAALDDIIFAEFNYLDPALESSMAAPEAPMRFAWIPPSSMGRGVAMVRPPESEEFDCEGALAAVIGLVRRRIAMDHTTGYSIINDGFVRAYQRFTSQWTMGKNLHCEGAFGPASDNSDALPLGDNSLKIEMRLNGQMVQIASTDDLIFDVATPVSVISVGITAAPGDIIVTGTYPARVSRAKPSGFMKHGDVFKVAAELEGIGILRNPVKDEWTTMRAKAV